MSKFFINRPIVAMVISILMVMVGAITIASLLIAALATLYPSGQAARLQPVDAIRHE